MKCATHGLKDRRDGRELSIVEPHVNIGASLSFEGRGFLVQRLKRMGGARQLAQRRRAKWTEVGRSGSFFSQNFIHCFSLRQLIDQFI